MIRGTVAGLITALMAFGVAGTAVAAEDPLEGDLRDLRVGMRAAELPTEGYVNFACAAERGEAGAPIDGWTDYASCTTNDAGLHQVVFEYDEDANPWAAVSDLYEGTQVAGHPVVPSLLIDDQGIVRGIRIVTDPNAPLYFKKKAFLLYLRVMGRYGKDGWDCVEREPAEGRRPIGGMYIDRHCEKRFHDRQLIMDTDLYRAAGQEGQEFTGRTRLDIFQAG